MNAADLPSETLFEGALNCRTPQERAAYLDRVCAGQPELRRKLETLLEAHDQSGRFLEPAVAASRPTVKLELPPEEPSGTIIGRYKLLQKIGEGGMGVVYMAEQTEPVVRKVAFKIIKLGMDTRQVVARFEAERQALALMDHPSIAKVLDAGATETGRPYFVMELVRGVSITEYCDKNKLSTRERLELFIPVCQAIQHAHQKGIIHRDIKPSNVMVTLHDGKPVPRVIDFGVAKATNQRLTEKTLFTNYAQMIGTPAYMSPEQAEMSGLDIDTRTDVYSLGVLLYELLTGTTPFDAKELLSKGYAEMQRIIAEQEPPRPSTRMSTLTEEERTVVATNRSMEAGALRRGLQGDLDWIVMKCLEKDRTRRYETSNGLAADLRRHLNNELIAARPPTTGYLLKKLIKRNKLTFAATSAVAAALVVGAAVATWQAVRARQAEALAKQHLAESEAITRFLTGVFQSPDPARDGRTITVAETLDKAVTNLETELASQPARRAVLQAALGATYYELGLHREAISLQEKVRDYYLARNGTNHNDTIVALYNLATSYAAAGRLDEALKLREEVLAFRRRVNGPENRSTITAMQNLAVSYQQVGRWNDALKLQEEVLSLRRRVLGPEHIDTIGAMNNLASTYMNVGRTSEAIKLQEQAVLLVGKSKGPEHPFTLGMTHNLASHFVEAGRSAEAIKLLEPLQLTVRKVMGAEHRDLFEVMHTLASACFAVGRLDEALKLREEVRALRQKFLGPTHPDTLLAMHNLAISYATAGRLGDAIKLQEEVLAGRRKILGPQHPDTLTAMHNLALSYNDAGRPADALKLWEESFPTGRNTFGSESPYTLEAMGGFMRAYAATGRHEEALKLGTELLAIRRKLLGPANPETLDTMTNLANSYEALGLKDQALKLREEASVVRQAR